MGYQLTNDGNILRKADGARIPLNERNAAYQDYLAWIAAGNEPEPAEPIDARAEHRRRADSEREAALGAAGNGVLWQGKRYHIDDRFLMELLGMVMGAQIGVLAGPQRVRTKDNEDVLLEHAQLVQLAAAVGTRRREIHEATWAAKDAL